MAMRRAGRVRNYLNTYPQRLSLLSYPVFLFRHNPPVGSVRLRPRIVCANVDGSQNLLSSSETKFQKRSIILQGGND